MSPVVCAFVSWPLAALVLTGFTLVGVPSFYRREAVRLLFLAALVATGPVALTVYIYLMRQL